MEIAPSYALPNMSTGFLQSLALLFLISTVAAVAQHANLSALNNQSSQADTTAYMVVQVPPKFPGGDEAMVQFIQSASQYPVSLKKGSLVQLKLLIEKDGSISRVHVAYTDATNELVEEARRIAQTMPKWIPGSQDGRLLRTYTVIPIRFANVKK